MKMIYEVGQVVRMGCWGVCALIIFAALCTALTAGTTPGTLMQAAVIIVGCYSITRAVDKVLYIALHSLKSNTTERREEPRSTLKPLRATNGRR